MIKKGHKIDSIYKKGREISKIVKKGQLVYTNGFPVESTFLTRTTAEGLDIRDDSVARVVSIKGNTWVKNQLIDDPTLKEATILATGCIVTKKDDRITVTNNNAPGFGYIDFCLNTPVIREHKYYYAVRLRKSIENTNRADGLRVYHIGCAGTTWKNSTNDLKWSLVHDIVDPSKIPSANVNMASKCRVLAFCEEFEVSSVMLIDLSKWFGVGKEPTTVRDLSVKLGIDSIENFPLISSNLGEVIGINHKCLPPVREVLVEQLFPKHESTIPIYGSSGTTLTGVCDSDDIITINGTCPYYCNFSRVQNTMISTLIQGHVYILAVEILNNPDNISLRFGAHNGKYNVIGSVSDWTKSYSYLCKCNSSTAGNGWGYSGKSGVPITFNNVKVRFSFYDLTKMGIDTFVKTTEDFYNLCPWALNYQSFSTQKKLIGFGIEETGKNFWGNNTSNQWINVSGVLVESTAKTTDKIPCSAGESFTLTGIFNSANTTNIVCISFRDKDDNNLLRTVSNAKEVCSVSGTAPVGTVYVRFAHYITAPLLIQAEKGDTATDYSPYHEPSLFPIDTTNFPYGINGFNNVYDEHTPNLDIRKYEKIDMGSLDWFYTSDPSSTIYRRFQSSIIPLPMKGSFTNGNIISTIYHHSTKPINPSFEDLAICYYNGRFYLYNSSYTDGDSFKNAMAGVFLYYELENPIVTPNNNLLQYKAYKGGTEQVIGSEVPITMNTKYKK